MAEESRIEKKLVKSVKEKGGLALKFVSPGNDGYPDRLVLIAYGNISFVEVKAPGEKPRKLQIARHKKLIKLGFKVFVLDDEKQIPQIIEDTMKGDNANGI